MNDLDPTIDPEEREALIAVADRLAAARPVPAPAFRGDLRRRILTTRPAPRALRSRIATCMVAGAALLLVAVGGVADVGPLAPETADALLALIIR